MELEGDVLVSPTGEVPVIEGEVVTAIRDAGGSRRRQARRLPATVGVARQYGAALSAAAGRRGAPGATGGAAADRRAARARRGRCTRGRRAAMRSSCSGCWPSAGSRSACGRSSARWPTFGARSAWRSSRRCASRRAPGDQLQIDFGQKRRADRRRVGAGLPAGRGAQLLAPALRQSVPQ